MNKKCKKQSKAAVTSAALYNTFLILFYMLRSASNSSGNND